MDVSAGLRVRATREMHRQRLKEAEQFLFSEGWHPTQAARLLAAKHECSTRQAHRYIATIRALYRQGAERAPAHNVDETIALLHAMSAQAKSGEDPDHKAAIKAIELACRLRGWLDRRSTVTVTGAVTVQHVAALDGLSTEALEALANAQRLIARDRDQRIEEPEIVGDVGALATLPADSE